MAQPLRLPNASEQAVLDALRVRLILLEEQPRWDELIRSRHYLKSARLVGEQLRYVAEFQGRWLALLGWSAPAFHLKARDLSADRQALGWAGQSSSAGAAASFWPKTAGSSSWRTATNCPIWPVGPWL